MFGQKIARPEHFSPDGDRAHKGAGTGKKIDEALD